MNQSTKKKDNLSRNAAIYTIGNFLNQAIAVITSPVFTRLLTTEEYGRITIYMTWVGMFTIFTGLELGGSLANAYIDYGKNKYKAYAKSCIVLSVLITLLYIILATLFRKELEVVFDLNYNLLILALLHSFFNSSILYLSKYLSLLKKAIPYVLISFGQMLLNVVLSIILILYSDWNPAISRIQGQFWASAVFGILVSLLFLLNKEKLLDFQYIKYGLFLSVPLMFHALGGIILSSSDKLMLSRMADDSVTGLYSFAVTVTSVIHVISVSFNIAWVPYLYETLRSRQIVSIQKRTERYLSCYTFVSCGFLLVMPEVVKILADKKYWDCIPLVIPLIIGEFYRFLYFFPVNYEFYNKQNQWIAFATLMTGGINVMLNFFWIPSWGMYGAVLSTVISYIICFVFHEIIARKLIGSFFMKVNLYIKYTVIIIIMSVITALLLEAIMVRWLIAFIYGGILLKRILIDKELF